jgi:hypothetical protein
MIVAANESNFINFFSRSSLHIEPLILFPKGLFFLSIITTAFLLKDRELPLYLRNIFFFVRTITAR